jgi:hypothetical protein
VELRSFSAGEVAIPWRRVRVASINLPSASSEPLDGVLGADSLSNFDIDLDLPHHRMAFYAQQSCGRAGPDWTEPYSRISTGRSLGYRLFFPVQLDGHRIDAFVDTGSQLSVVSTTAARALGVTDAALALDRPAMLRGAAGEQLSARVHRFMQMKIGAEVILNPDLIVTNVNLRDGDVVLGIDFLALRRIWLSYGSRQIFLSRRG